MKQLRIVLHNTANRPIFLDLSIDDSLANAIQKFGITRSELLISDRPINMIVPDLGKIRKAGLNDYKISPS